MSPRRTSPYLPVMAALLVVAAMTGREARAADSGTVSATLGVSAVQLQVALDVSESRPRLGKETTFKARARNTGSAPFGPVSVRLVLVPQLPLVAGENPATVAALRPGKHAEVKWKVCAAQQGSYLLVATAQVPLAGGGTASFVSNVVLVEVRPPANSRDRCP